MVKKVFKYFVVLVVILTSLSFNDNANAGDGAELRNAEAFSGKNSYHASGGYFIYTSYATHRNAYNNAISKINSVSGADINLNSIFGSTITMQSVNSSSYDWYGHAEWTQSWADLLINDFTCSLDGFTQTNYNKTALHEVGHAFYMVHQASSVDSVMKQGKYSYSDYSALDKANFASQY